MVSATAAALFPFAPTQSAPAVLPEPKLRWDAEPALELALLYGADRACRRGAVMPVDDHGVAAATVGGAAAAAVPGRGGGTAGSDAAAKRGGTSPSAAAKEDREALQSVCSSRSAPGPTSRAGAAWRWGSCSWPCWNRGGQERRPTAGAGAGALRSRGPPPSATRGAWAPRGGGDAAAVAGGGPRTPAVAHRRRGAAPGAEEGSSVGGLEEPGQAVAAPGGAEEGCAPSPARAPAPGGAEEGGAPSPARAPAPTAGGDGAATRPGAGGGGAWAAKSWTRAVPAPAAAGEAALAAEEGRGERGGGVAGGRRPAMAAASAAAREGAEDKSVIGRPAEFALVDADGNTAFLEKALKFIEDYGVKVEGILRQSADVEEVKRRIRDYEKGKNEFSPEEDAHVIGDCIKYILREMPSSPVPASCCTSLVRAYRTDKTRRLDAMNRVIYEDFPEPNRQLLQRILKMMQIVGSHKAVNRMSASALAACMAPLLLRPLLLGECEIDSDFNMAGDSSFQLLQAAAAANHAQAIVIIMLEEYDQIFDDIEDGSYSSDAYTESDIDKEYSTDNDIHEDDGSYGSGEDDVEEDLNDDTKHSSGSRGERDSNIRVGNADDQVISGAACDENDKVVQPPVRTTRVEHGVPTEESNQIGSLQKVDKTSQMESNLPSQSKQESTNESKRNSWGRTSARKDLSTEEANCCGGDDDEARIVKLENNKSHLQSKITMEVKENTVLQASLERRKEALHERRVALEKEVENLRDQLQKERNLRASLESGLMNMRRGQVSFPSTIDSKTKADLEEVAAAEADIMNLKQKVSDLRGQLNNQAQLSSTSLCESCNNKQLLNTDKIVDGEQNAALSTEISSSGKATTVPDMFWATNQMVQKMLASKDGQDGSLTTKWNFAQRQNSSNPVMNKAQGSSTKTEESGMAPSSALAKLTSRLNFLKERRALLASEMQNLDLGRPQAQGHTAPPKGDSS